MQRCQWQSRHFCASFFFHFDHDYTFLLLCLAYGTGKRCTTITVKFTPDFHWFVDVSECCIIKISQHIRRYLINISDGAHLRIHTFNFFCLFTRREIKLMTDQHISLVLIDGFTIDKPMQCLIIRKIISVFIRTCDLFYHGWFHKRKEVKIHLSVRIIQCYFFDIF